MLQMNRRHRNRRPVNAEINITNLVDVAFVLLIIFMITAPILQGGVEVELPRSSASPITASEAVIVSIASDGRVFLDQVEVTEAEFPTAFAAFMGDQAGDRPVFVKGDRNVPYGRVMEVFGMLKDLDVRNVSMVVESKES
ncbi:MAG: biopolymer transporter ExbD [Candidatus Cloacimonetes bacterium]|jgi:biopolymer transport protein TolR|nr:biopolymer transporter ExbD [Candidatus Cloacimonadota bacterium]